MGVASQFVGDGIVYQAVDRSGKCRRIQIKTGRPGHDIPLVVLANGNTASAAEIVTGCIQDAGRGKVVGEKTFGTGTVLGRFDLADGSSLRIGTERWLTRNGRPIWHEGLDPDVTVALPTRRPVPRDAARHDRASSRPGTRSCQGPGAAHRRAEPPGNRTAAGGAGGRMPCE